MPPRIIVSYRAMSKPPCIPRGYGFRATAATGGLSNRSGGVLWEPSASARAALFSAPGERQLLLPVAGDVHGLLQLLALAAHRHGIRIGLELRIEQRAVGGGIQYRLPVARGDPQFRVPEEM